MSLSTKVPLREVSQALNLGTIAWSEIQKDGTNHYLVLMLADGTSLYADNPVVYKRPKTQAS